MSRARLVFIEKDGKNRPSEIPPNIMLTKERTTIGRSRSADLTMDSEAYPCTLSRTHVVIWREDIGNGEFQWHVSDSHTMNGTFIGCVKVSDCEINDGEIITLGGGAGLNEGERSDLLASDLVFRFEVIYDDDASVANVTLGNATLLPCGPTSANGTPGNATPLPSNTFFESFEKSYGTGVHTRTRHTEMAATIPPPHLPSVFEDVGVPYTTDSLLNKENIQKQPFYKAKLEQRRQRRQRQWEKDNKQCASSCCGGDRVFVSIGHTDRRPKDGEGKITGSEMKLLVQNEGSEEQRRTIMAKMMVSPLVLCANQAAMVMELPPLESIPSVDIELQPSMSSTNSVSKDDSLEEEESMNSVSNDISSSLDIEEEKESKFDIANIGTTPAIRNMDRDVNPSCKNCVDAGRPVPTNATVTGCNQQLVGTKSLLKYDGHSRHWRVRDEYPQCLYRQAKVNALCNYCQSLVNYSTKIESLDKDYFVNVPVLEEHENVRTAWCCGNLKNHNALRLCESLFVKDRNIHTDIEPLQDYFTSKTAFGHRVCTANEEHYKNNKAGDYCNSDCGDVCLNCLGLDKYGTHGYNVQVKCKMSYCTNVNINGINGGDGTFCGSCLLFGSEHRVTIKKLFLEMKKTIEELKQEDKVEIICKTGLCTTCTDGKKQTEKGEEICEHCVVIQFNDILNGITIVEQIMKEWCNPLNRNRAGWMVSIQAKEQALQNECTVVDIFYDFSLDQTCFIVFVMYLFYFKI